jgi:hypothetical protein
VRATCPNESDARATNDDGDDEGGCKWFTAADECFKKGQAPLCRYEQVFRACKSETPGFSIGRSLWLADREKDALATKSSISGCKDFANEYDLDDSKRGGYCCLEWMIY